MFLHETSPNLNDDETAMSLGRVIHRMRQRRADPAQVAHLQDRLARLTASHPIIARHFGFGEG
tara:strand:+ start:3369 stop:3557 length:189 start_codon:yes stop_codon:yes gene_type:complete